MFKRALSSLIAAAALLGSVAFAEAQQTFPQVNLPPGTFFGRLPGTAGPGEAIPFSYLFNSLFYTAPGTGGVARTQAAKNFDTVSIVDYGGDPTGVATSDSALTNAFAALATSPSGRIYFPRGTYSFASAKSLTLASTTASLTLEGDGSEASILTWPNTFGGITINYDGPLTSAHVRDLSFVTAQAGGGSGLKLSQSGTCMGFFDQSSIERVTFRGSDNAGVGGANYWTVGYLVNGVSGVNVEKVNVFGPGLGTSGIGGEYQGTGSGCYSLVDNVHASNFQSLQNGIEIVTYVQGFTMSQSNIENGTNGLVLVSGGVGFAQVAVSDSQFAQAGGNQILIQAPVAALQLSNNLIYVAANFAGVNATANLADFMITGNDFSGNSLTGSYGIALTGSTVANTPGTITGNGFKTLAQALSLGASVANVNVQGNSFQGNTATVSDGGTNNVVANNIGFNPVGVTAAITVGASPATICASNAPETDYFTQSATFGATVKLGSGSGPLVGTMSAANVEVVTNLGPHECEAVTWATTAPTYSKSIH